MIFPQTVTTAFEAGLFLCSNSGLQSTVKNNFFGIDSLLESITAVEIPASIAPPDTDCFLKMPKMVKLKHSKKSRIQNSKIQTSRQKKVFYDPQNILVIISYSIRWAFLTFQFYLVPNSVPEKCQNNLKLPLLKQYSEVFLRRCIPAAVVVFSQKCSTNLP